MSNKGNGNGHGVAPEYLPAERHAVLRLVGRSPSGSHEADPAAVEFLLAAGFVAEKPDVSVHRGAIDPTRRNVLEISRQKNANKRGNFKLLRLSSDGGVQTLEDGYFGNLDDKVSGKWIVDGNGYNSLSNAQIVVDSKKWDPESVLPDKPAEMITPEPPPVTLVKSSRIYPQKSQGEDSKGEFWMDVDCLRPWAGQPRKVFRDAALDELGNSLLTGQMRAILICPLGPDQAAGKVCSEIVDGERRWRAAQLKRIPKVLVSMRYPIDEADQHRMSVVSNMHAVPHTHYEYATAIIYAVKKAGRSIDDVAKDFSMSGASVRNYLSLSALVPSLFELLSTSQPKGKKLPLGCGVLLAKVKPEKQEEILAQAIQESGHLGRRGLAACLEALIIGNKTEKGPNGGKRREQPCEVAKLARTAIEAVRLSVHNLNLWADGFRASEEMKQPVARLALASNMRETADRLRQFAEKLVAHPS
ncbi:MAG: ParB/RepB/Spo0J family partition protein [Patescibacteria group bacterium]